MNGHSLETQGAWRTLPQEHRKQLIVLLGQMIRHQVEKTRHRKEHTTRNAVDKTPCLRQDARYLSGGML